jgi:predicted nucleic acid-binding protein
VIVYIESNFVLEMALEQEQVSSALALLDLAENQKISLIFPSFVLGECYECIMRERRVRNELQNNLVKALKNLQRSKPYERVKLDLEPMVDVLKDAYTTQIDGLHITIDRLLGIGINIGVDQDCFREALRYQGILSLSPQDSIIYAAMIADLKTRSLEEKKYFLSRDRKAFGNDDDRDIKAELDTYKCRYIGSFVQGLDAIMRELK